MPTTARHSNGIPILVGVAASGDMGFTSGPWSAHAAGTDGLAHGHFLTVWKRGDDGIWRVQVDGGISHPAAKPATDVAVLVRGNERRRGARER